MTDNAVIASVRVRKNATDYGEFFIYFTIEDNLNL